MHYDYFISIVKQYETDRVKAFVGDRCGSTARIPKPFALLMQDIIEILNNNLSHLCKDDEGIVITGLQPAVNMIHSSLPSTLNRKITEDDDSHLCCTLEYIVLPKEQLVNATHWTHTCSVVVDFTAGTLMDLNEYLSRLSLQVKQPGTVYGWLNYEILAAAWNIVKLKSNYFQAYAWA